MISNHGTPSIENDITGFSVSTSSTTLPLASDKERHPLSSQNSSWVLGMVSWGVGSRGRMVVRVMGVFGIFGSERMVVVEVGECSFFSVLVRLAWGYIYVCIWM